MQDFEMNVTISTQSKEWEEAKEAVKDRLNEYHTYSTIYQYPFLAFRLYLIEVIGSRVYEEIKIEAEGAKNVTIDPEPTLEEAIKTARQPIQEGKIKTMEVSFKVHVENLEGFVNVALTGFSLVGFTKLD